MSPDYFFFYCEASIVCVIIFVILLLHDRKYSSMQEKQIWFNRTVIAHILYFVSDIGWAAVIGGVLPRTRFPVVLFNTLNFLFMGMLGYSWFRYMAASEKMKLRLLWRRQPLAVLPLAFSILVYAFLLIVFPRVLITDGNDLTPWYSLFLLLVPICYILASFICSMVNAKKTENPDEKRLYKLIGYYPLSVVFVGLLQRIFLDAPLFCFGCTIMMLFFYIENLQALISVDALTRLNNRGQIDRYIKQVRYRDDIQTWGLMIDIDRFKHINDTYGHAEGDRALILVSGALRQTAGQMNTREFIGRYGGDEFTVIFQTDEENVEKWIAALRENVRMKRKENNLPYELELSVGWDALRDANDTMSACLNRADEKLYSTRRRT